MSFVSIGLGPLGPSYILHAGGLGCFRKGIADLHIATVGLELVECAPDGTA
jgi:hypothetical protein